ncbi:MAG: VOC family protein [Spirochaetaceae bacterium]|nr:VOC family protein [Myxococcales bacterium]MCB9724080.1 VOC family protein [Spirochaetaceae bacterium]HPG25453.1 VOC family protein [Myxococcota bacterium]
MPDLHGTINHVALTVSDLDEAMRFYAPFLQALGYTTSEPMPYQGSRFTVNVHETHGTAINVWQATKAHAFDPYEPGLHHLAFNVSSKSAVDAIHDLARELGAEILDGPAEFPFAHQGYYAVYLLGPDDVKIEVVHMAGLASAIERGRASEA